MSNERRVVSLILMYRNKVDIQSCLNFCVQETKLSEATFEMDVSML